MRVKLIAIYTMLLLLAISAAAQASVTLYTPAAGDATFEWNSKYGPYGYGTGSTTMGIYSYMGGIYGNDRTISIFEIPIAELIGKTVNSATLVVEALGFGTGYYYGSASIGWLNTGTATLTGDVVADKLGPVAQSSPSGFKIYDSDVAFTDGLKSFNVLDYVLEDLAAGRSYSTFVMSGSRETYGSLYTAESGSGPRIIADIAVPEPTSITMLGMGLAGMLLKRRRKG